ncbi:hypothetical protein [Alkalihalobacillus sp. AL-G]|uniref:hypothetical protein n=1 Tax=Alkalihalobacillus sp. AL-G TaxID=2926399 RepID=UPI00272CA185|nr:hypothetical protein [Alkalihalobacillus sp. AL-G]WLD94392.1 hypothetical protein MOJ78_05760 [Alkalihalobacillus sp. AL-G]
MSQTQIGMAGIGRLGIAMMKHWCDCQIPVGIYHPDHTKAANFIARYPNGYVINEDEIHELDAFVLAVPADKIIPFISQCVSRNIAIQNTYILNMATALKTSEVSSRFPDLNIASMKFMGHSNDLFENGNGLFITEHIVPDEILDIFRVIGKVKQGNEEIVSKVNKLATYQAVKAAIELEKVFDEKNLPPEYKNRALTSLLPEVIRSYSKGNLGHFAQEIVNEIKRNNNTSNK